MESLRRNSVIPEIESVHEVDLRPDPAGHDRIGASLEVLQLLWNKRSLLLRVAVRSLALSLVVAFLIPKRYESSVSIMPPDSLGNGAILAALAERASPGLSAMAGNLLGMKNTGALFVSLLGSRTVQEQIVERFDLLKVYHTRYKTNARKVLAQRTSINEDRKSGVISVAVWDENPHRAHDIAQAYVEELDRLVSQVSTSSARRERMFIEQRLTSVRTDLEDAEKQFSAFASKNGALDIKEQTKAMVESAAVLQGQLIAAQSELQGLEQIYTESNVRVRSLKARVAELNAQLQKIGGTAPSSMDADKVSDELYPSIRQLPLLGVQWADLYRRMKIQETVYELLNQQYELARIQEAKEIPTVNVIDPANLPEKRSYPPRLLVALLLTLLSLLCTVGLILAVDRWRSVDPGDPRRVFASHIIERSREWLQTAKARLHIGALRARGRSRGQSDG